MRVNKFIWSIFNPSCIDLLAGATRSYAVSHFNISYFQLAIHSQLRLQSEHEYNLKTHLNKYNGFTAVNYVQDS